MRDGGSVAHPPPPPPPPPGSISPLNHSRNDAMQCNGTCCHAMHCAMQCNATQCNAIRNAMQRDAMQCIATQCNATQRNAMQRNANAICNMQCVVRQVVLMLGLDTTTVEKEGLDRVNISLPGLQAWRHACAPAVRAPMLSRARGLLRRLCSARARVRTLRRVCSNAVLRACGRTLCSHPPPHLRTRGWRGWTAGRIRGAGARARQADRRGAAQRRRGRLRRARGRRAGDRRGLGIER